MNIFKKPSHLSLTALALAALSLSTFMVPSNAMAEDTSCKTINMFDPSWTDINATNGVADVLLDGLGYEAKINLLSVPIGYQTMKSGGVDVFLGNWMPAQAPFITDLQEADAVDILVRNLEGAKFTLAVPDYVAKSGIKSIQDLQNHAKDFDQKIYGIEPGAPANANIQKIIESGDFGLNQWSLIESGEQAMLAQVERYTKKKTPVVFLAWAPHPMNERLNIEYLSGGDDYFGPNYGGAEVYTLARKGWAVKCPNAAQFFTNLTFDIGMENTLMGMILNDGMHPKIAAKNWLKKNPDRLDTWLKDVKTFDGKDGLTAVKEELSR